MSADWAASAGAALITASGRSAREKLVAKVTFKLLEIDLRRLMADRH